MINPPNPWSFGPSDFRRSPCPQCGARTENQAETRCTASPGIDDEYHCAADEGIVDKQGYFKFVSKAAIKRADREFEKWLETEDGEMWKDRPCLSQ